MNLVTASIILLVITLVMTSCHQTVNDEDHWKISPSFGAFRGVEGKVGFLDVPFVIGKENKYMWHFWDDDFDQNGVLKVKGTSRETGKEQIIIEALPLAGPLNGARAHAPSLMALDSSGLWKLDVYVSDKFIESIVVHVAES